MYLKKINFLDSKNVHFCKSCKNNQLNDLDMSGIPSFSIRPSRKFKASKEDVTVHKDKIRTTKKTTLF